MKGLIKTSLKVLALSLFSSLSYGSAEAALQTHRLNYTYQSGPDAGSTLTADIIFDDTNSEAYQDQTFANGTEFKSFVNSLTFTYNSGSGADQTFDLDDYFLMIYTINVDPKTNLDYDGTPSLKSQITDLRLASGSGPTNESGANSEFRMTFNDNEFLLSSTT